MSSVGPGGEAGVAALERVGAGRPAPRRRAASSRRRRRPAARARRPARRPPGPTGSPTRAAISSSPLRRQVSEGGHDQGDGEGEAERRARPTGRISPTATVPMTAGPDGDRHRQQRAQVEVLQRVDVVDGPGQEVAAAPPGERGRHPGREAVVEPHPPAGERAQRGIVADQAFGVAQRPAQEGEHLDGGQDADERGQARAAARRGRRRSPTRPAGRWWRRRRPGRAARPGPAARRACPARRGRGAADAPCAGSRRDRQREAARPPAGSPRRRSGGGGAGSCAATTTVRPASQGSIAGARRATVGGSSGGRGLVEQENRVPGGAGHGPGPRAGARPSSA